MSALWVIPSELGELADSEYAYEACKSASFLLWALSGRKFSGLTKVTEVYRSTTIPYDFTQLLMAQTQSHLLYEYFAHLPHVATRLRLRGRPVLGVDLVRIGADLRIADPDSYYLTDHSTLNFRSDVREDIEVTYRYGTQPPVAGRMAARTLAQQFALLWSGSDECELPARVTSVARQGITFTILDQQDFIADLRTGVYAVDLFLKSVNPNNALRKSRVFSPDVIRGQRYTPKTFNLPETALDIAIPQAVGEQTITFSLDSIDADYLASETGWTPELILRSNGGKKSLIVTTGVSLSGTDLSVTISYADAVAVVGNVDPGTWDLYIVQNNVSTYTASGNLSIILSTR